MSQNTEEASELVATIKADQVKMRQWYNNPDNKLDGLKTKYGEFPTFWQEILNWPGWKETRKEYILYLENGSKKRSRDNFALTPSSSENRPSRQKSRRSRWAKSSSTNDHDIVPINPADPVMAALGLGGNIQAKRTAAGLCFSANVPEDKKEEFNSLQERLRKANSRLDNLEVEAGMSGVCAFFFPEFFLIYRTSCNFQRVLMPFPAATPTGLLLRRPSMTEMVGSETHAPSVGRKSTEKSASIVSSR